MNPLFCVLSLLLFVIFLSISIYTAFHYLRRIRTRLSVVSQAIDRITRSVEQCNFFARLACYGAGCVPAINEGWAINYDQAILIFDILAGREWSFMVEIGSGSSTNLWAFFLRNYQDRNLVSIEADQEHFRRTSDFLRKVGHGGDIQLIYAPYINYEINGDSWKWYDIGKLDRAREIDILFVDGPPDTLQPLSRYPAIPLLWQYLSPNVVIILDDGNRQQEKEIAARWTKEFPLEAKFIPTEKGTWIFRRIE